MFNKNFHHMYKCLKRNVNEMKVNRFWHMVGRRKKNSKVVDSQLKIETSFSMTQFITVIYGLPLKLFNTTICINRHRQS